MDFVKTIHKIDKGRVIAVPVFTLLMLLNIFNFCKGAGILLPINTIKMVGFVHHLLIICFYALVVLLYFLRTSASSTTMSFWAKAIAIIATFLPFTLPLLGGHILGNPVIVLMANLIMTVGMSFSTYALIVLGRSFSIIPQTRGLVQNGPYRLVRHPLYLGELVIVFGMVMARPTLSTIAVFFLLVSCQVYRAFHEEILLGSIFPEYESYSLKTACFIPGVF